jgi:DNA-directed RNA polymerase subunit RPC12/RpoP
MSISFECAQCGKKLKAPDAAAGRSSKCPACGGKVTCPAPVPAAKMAQRPAASPPPSSPTGLDDFKNVDDGTPYALMEPDPIPAASPPPGDAAAEPGDSASSASRTKQRKKTGAKGKGRDWLKKIAFAHKGILVSILLQIVLYIGAFLTPPQFRLVPLGAWMIAGLVGTVFTFMLAIRLYNALLGILLSVLTLIPLINLVVLWTMSGKATKVLRDAGHHVGFLGARLSEF